MADDNLSRVFAALADPTRRDLVARLAVADATVSEPAEQDEVSIQAVPKHIEVLADAGLVSQSRDAQRRPCHLEADVLDLMTKWIECHRQQAEERGFHGCFHEVGEERIVQTFTYEGEPDGVAPETLWSEALDDGRTRLHAQSLVDSFEARDQWLASGMETGLGEGHANLATLVGEL